MIQWSPPPPPTPRCPGPYLPRPEGAAHDHSERGSDLEYRDTKTNEAGGDAFTKALEPATFHRMWARVANLPSGFNFTHDQKL